MSGGKGVAVGSSTYCEVILEFQKGQHASIGKRNDTDTKEYVNWLVVGTLFIFPYIGNNDPN